MDEALKTLRLIHISLIGVCAAIGALAAAQTGKHGAALRELDTLDFALKKNRASYYALCDRIAEANVFQGRRRREAEELLRDTFSELDLQKVYSLSPNVEVRTFVAFCDEPEQDETLERYEDFFLADQAIQVALLSKEGFRQGLLDLLNDARRDPPDGECEILGVECHMQSRHPLGRTALSGMRVAWPTNAIRFLTTDDGIFLEHRLRCGTDTGGGTALFKGATDGGLSYAHAAIGVRWLAEVAPSLVDAMGTSTILFPRLKQFWGSVRRLKIADAYEHVEREWTGERQNLSILGMSLREDIAVWAGPLVTFLTLCYFKVNLSHFLSMVMAGTGEGIHFPWIGLYRGWLSAALLYSSVVVLPVCSNLFLLRAWNHWDLSGQAATALVVACGLMSAMVAMELAAVRRALQPRAPRILLP